MKAINPRPSDAGKSKTLLRNWVGEGQIKREEDMIGCGVMRCYFKVGDDGEGFEGGNNQNFFVCGGV